MGLTGVLIVAAVVSAVVWAVVFFVLGSCWARRRIQRSELRALQTCEIKPVDVHRGEVLADQYNLPAHVKKHLAHILPDIVEVR